MKVRIRGDISGSRDGVPWPKRGEVMELPDDEGAQLCASGLATPVKDTEKDVEKAVPDDDSEKRSGLTTENSGALTSDGGQGSQGADSEGAEEKQDQAPAAKKATTPAKKTTAAAKKTAAPAKPQAESK
ncbi:hypothetical protein ACH41H_36470 [Streptomyces sp. NPDC020800]|uniref:hypothetical protein n=1 Tax=Streptomyces sp. NPDC020800 TaxID=3365092 RepID=UPI00378DD8E4